jgi:hypothetical protein
MSANGGQHAHYESCCRIDRAARRQSARRVAGNDRRNDKRAQHRAHDRQQENARAQTCGRHTAATRNVFIGTIVGLHFSFPLIWRAHAPASIRAPSLYRHHLIYCN